MHLGRHCFFDFLDAAIFILAFGSDGCVFDYADDEVVVGGDGVVFFACLFHPPSSIISNTADRYWQLDEAYYQLTILDDLIVDVTRAVFQDDDTTQEIGQSVHVSSTVHRVKVLRETLAANSTIF